MITSNKTLLLLSTISSLIAVTLGANCELVESSTKASDASNQVGLIFVPGDTIPGERYIPLVKAILADYPGNAWGAVTRDWGNNFPNPVGMGEAVQACYEQVSESTF